MKTKKLKIKKKVINIIIILVLLIVGSVIGFKQYKVYKYKQTIEYKLSLNGYNKNEINLIENKLGSDYLDGLVDKEKDTELLKIISQKYFIKNNLERYISYIKKDTNYSLEDIIAVVNVNADEEWYKVEKETNLNDGYHMIVNKVYKLNESYAPDDIANIKTLYAYDGHKIRKEVNDFYINLWNAAKEAGFTFVVNSSYRTYAEQTSLYDRLYNANGRKKTDALAARPGHSEHQTGMALDIVIHGVPTSVFHEHDAYKWLLDNCYKYGFILRYPEGKQYITGFEFESWHYRYVGIELATKIHNEGITFDEYYAYYLAKEQK